MTTDQFREINKAVNNLQKGMNSFRVEVNRKLDETVSQDQFTKLFKHAEKNFSEIRKELDKKASQDSIDRLTNTLDRFASRLEDSEVERASDGYRFEKLLDWARSVSKKTGIPIKDL